MLVCFPSPLFYARPPAGTSRERTRARTSSKTPARRRLAGAHLGGMFCPLTFSGTHDYYKTVQQPTKDNRDDYRCAPEHDKHAAKKLRG